MKVCTSCNQAKPLDAFYFIKSRNRHLHKCIVCKQQYDKSYWQLTGTKRRSQKKKNISQIRDRNTRYILSYLREHPCVLCLETDPLVLEFDHINPSLKEANVSELLSYSIERIEVEIAKCRVLCANCHRRETAKQFQYSMWALINSGV